MSGTILTLELSFSGERPIGFSVNGQPIGSDSAPGGEFRSGRTTIVVHPDPFRYDLWFDGFLISQGIELAGDGASVTDRRVLDGRCYGLGEHLSERIERNGLVFQAWNKDKSSYHNPLYETFYASFPCMVFRCRGSSHWFGYGLGHTGKSVIDVGNSDQGVVSAKIFGSRFTVHLFTGDGLPEVHRAMVHFLGRPFLPDPWMIGFHHSRYGYSSSEQIEAVAQRFRDDKVPVESLWYDIDTADRFRNFTLSPTGFPDLQSHFACLRRLGLRSVFFLNPGIRVDPEYGLYREGMALDVFLKKDGQVYVGELWGGACVFPDVTSKNIDAWLGSALGLFESLGYGGLCLDMGEPTDFSQGDRTFPLTVQCSSPLIDPASHHNLYANLLAQRLAEVTSRKGSARKFLVSRAGFTGIQRHAALWTGDNYATWNHLRSSLSQVINAGLSGVGFIGADVGGFWGNADDELLVRWYQLGAFYPFFRNHSDKHSRSSTPWSVSKDCQRYCVEAIRLRYRLLPYLHQQFRDMSLTGKPLFRPLFFDYPEDVRAQEIHDQFLWGDAFLVAPVLDPEAKMRPVYFPEGTWIDFHTGTPYGGRSLHGIEVTLESCPLFVKKSAVIQVADPVDHADQIPVDTVKLLVCGPWNHECTSIWDRTLPGNHEVTLSYREPFVHFSFSAASAIRRIEVLLWEGSDGLRPLFSLTRGAGQKHVRHRVSGPA